MYKWIFAATLWAAAALGSLAAWAAQHRGESCLRLAGAFAGGALLSAGLVHLLANAVEESEDDEFPWSELLCGLGCLLTHCFEAIAEAAWSPSSSSPEPVKSVKARQSPKPEAKVPEPAIVGASAVVSQVEPEEGRTVTTPDRTSEPPDEDAGESWNFLSQDRDAGQLPGVRQVSHAGHAVDGNSLEHGRRSSLLVGPLLMLALSFHSLLEGLSLGAAASPTAAAHLFVAILVHKGIAAFSLGVAWLAGDQALSKRYVGAMAWFAFITPAGILVGSSLEGSALGTRVTALSAGTFIYVGLVESCPGVRVAWLPGRLGPALQLGLYAVGFGVMAALGAVA